MRNRETDLEEFIIEYDYFGLSNSAEVKKRKSPSEPYYKCFLHSSAQEIDIKQVKDESAKLVNFPVRIICTLSKNQSNSLGYNLSFYMLYSAFRISLIA